MEKKPVSHFVVGVIISLVLIISFLIFYFTGNAFQKNAVSYIPSVLFVGIIIYSIIQFSNANNNNVTFGKCFSYGFKASAIVALIMCVFLAVFIYSFPDYKQSFLQFMSNEFEKSSRPMTDEQREAGLTMMEKFFSISIIGGSLFMNLIAGAIASLIGAAAAKKNPQDPFTQQG